MPLFLTVMASLPAVADDQTNDRVNAAVAIDQSIASICDKETTAFYEWAKENNHKFILTQFEDPQTLELMAVFKPFLEQNHVNLSHMGKDNYCNGLGATWSNNLLRQVKNNPDPITFFANSSFDYFTYVQDYRKAISSITSESENVGSQQVTSNPVNQNVNKAAVASSQSVTIADCIDQRPPGCERFTYEDRQAERQRRFREQQNQEAEAKLVKFADHFGMSLDQFRNSISINRQCATPSVGTAFSPSDLIDWDNEQVSYEPLYKALDSFIEKFGWTWFDITDPSLLNTSAATNTTQVTATCYQNLTELIAPFQSGEINPSPDFSAAFSPYDKAHSAIGFSVAIGNLCKDFVNREQIQMLSDDANLIFMLEQSRLGSGPMSDNNLRDVTDAVAAAYTPFRLNERYTKNEVFMMGGAASQLEWLNGYQFCGALAEEFLERYLSDLKSIDQNTINQLELYLAQYDYEDSHCSQQNFNDVQCDFYNFVYNEKMFDWCKIAKLPKNDTIPDRKPIGDGYVYNVTNSQITQLSHEMFAFKTIERNFTLAKSAILKRSYIPKLGHETTLNDEASVTTRLAALADKKFTASFSRDVANIGDLTDCGVMMMFPDKIINKYNSLE